MQMDMHRWLAFVLIILTAAACSSGEGTSSTIAPAPATTAPQADPTTTDASAEAAPSTVTATSAVATTDPFEPLASVLIAALGDALAGTSYADAPFENPEVFIATGQLFCELLDQGADPKDLITDYVTALSDKTVEEAGEDELVLTGSVLGTSVEVLCPQHRPLLEGSS